MVAMDRFFSHLNAHVWRIFPCHVRLPGDVYTVYQCMSSCPPTLGQATFTRGAQVDQEVAAQIKQVEARSWTTAVLNFEIGPEIGGTLVCGKLNGERWESYFKLSNSCLGFPWRVERLTNGDVSRERLRDTRYGDRRIQGM